MSFHPCQKVSVQVSALFILCCQKHLLSTLVKQIVRSLVDNLQKRSLLHRLQHRQMYWKVCARNSQCPASR
jgi:hypothetical protein